MKIKKIFITGGGGYVGSVLVPLFLKNNFEVTVLDLMIYGKDVLPIHPKLNIIKGDIRDKDLLQKTVPFHDAVIHLACISNDPSFELNPKLGKSINLDSFEPFVEICIKNKIKRFIYASSSSVYGIKKEKNVSEEMVLEPLTDYSKYKADCEKILKNYQSEDFTTVILRPATVCGYSPRQRLDVVVNILTNLAYNKRKISIFGGDQLRPNLHIKDMANAYLNVINAEKKDVEGQIFNVGTQNLSVSSIAYIVKNIVGDDVVLEIVKSNDNRSYHISSKKIKNVLGFIPKYTIENAIEELANAFKNNLLTNALDNEKYYNIKRMQSINLE